MTWVRRISYLIQGTFANITIYNTVLNGNAMRCNAMHIDKALAIDKLRIFSYENIGSHQTHVTPPDYCYTDYSSVLTTCFVCRILFLDCSVHEFHSLILQSVHSIPWFLRLFIPFLDSSVHSFHWLNHVFFFNSFRL